MRKLWGWFWPNHVATEFSNIYEGEVVLFHFPDNIKEIYVKRVIELPGDIITKENPIQ